MAEFGGIDILHNNVGVVIPGGPVDLDEAHFQRGLDLNLGSVYRTAKVGAAALHRAQGRRYRQHLLARRDPLDRLSVLRLLRGQGRGESGDGAIALQYASHGITGQLHHAGHDRHAADLRADRRPTTRPPRR